MWGDPISPAVSPGVERFAEPNRSTLRPLSFVTHCPPSDGDGAMRFNHVGIPTTTRFEGEIDLPHLKVTGSDHQSNPFGIQWMRYWEDAPYPDLVKTVAHVAFEVDDLEQTLSGQEVIIPPNSPC